MLNFTNIFYLLLSLCSLCGGFQLSAAEVKEAQPAQEAPPTQGAELTQTPPLSETIQEFHFRGRQDSFKLTQRNGQWSLGKDDVSLKPIESFLPALLAQLTDTCPALPPRPDISIELKLPDSRTKKDFFLAERVMQEGKHCATLDGHGIYALPLHRSWFVGDRRPAQIRLMNSFALGLSEGRNLEFERLSGRQATTSYRSVSKDFFVDQSFFDRWIQSLADFRVDSRWHPAFAEKATRSLTLTSGSAEYKFFYLPMQLWAVQRPGVFWLEIDNRWGFWQNFSDGLIFDPLHERLTLIVNAGAEERDRVRAIAQLGDSWSEGIRQALYQVLGRSYDSPEVKAQALRALRKRPSEQNLSFQIELLSTTSDPLLLRLISENLRVRNPSGPLIAEELFPGERQPLIEQWISWWAEQKK